MDTRDGSKRRTREYQGINCGQNLPLLAYADNVVILGESEQDIKKATELLIQSVKKRGLNINETKTKYRRIGRNKDQRRNAAGNWNTGRRICV